MSVLDTLRSWFRSLLGGEAEPAEPAEPTDSTVEAEPDDSRLDPDGVTEVRVESGDDPVDQLREVKKKRDEPARGNRPGENIESRDESDGS